MKMVLEKKRRRIEGGFFAYWESHPLKLKDASQAETNGPKKEKTAKRDLQKKFMALWKRNPGVEEKRNLKWEKMGFCFHNSLNKSDMDENVFYLLYRLLRRIQGEGGVQLEDIFAPSEGKKELFWQFLVKKGGHLIFVSKTPARVSRFLKFGLRKKSLTF